MTLVQNYHNDTSYEHPRTSRDHADFRKILSENGEEITSSLYNNNHSVPGPNSNKVSPTLPLKLQ